MKTLENGLMMTTKYFIYFIHFIQKDWNKMIAWLVFIYLFLIGE